MRKSVAYNIIGVICLLETLIAIIGWAGVRQPQIQEEGFARVYVYYPLAPALPYLAFIACVLGFLCFIFGYEEGLRKATKLVK